MSSQGSPKLWRNLAVAGGLVAFGTTMALIPWWLRNVAKVKNLQNSEKPLSGSQMQRGLYIQAGQKDAGPDPDWQGGVYIPNELKKRKSKKE